MGEVHPSQSLGEGAEQIQQKVDDGNGQGVEDEGMLLALKT